MENINILIADDEVDACHFIQKSLLREGFNVDVTFNGKEALDKMREKDYDFAFLDFNMPELTGLEVTKHAKQNDSRCVIIMITGYPSMDDFFAKALGVDEYLEKPFTIDDIKKIINKYKERGKR